MVKQAAVSEKMMNFTGRARVFDSEAQAMKAIVAGGIVKGDVVVIRYRGSQGRAGNGGDALPDLPDLGHGAVQ